MESTCLLRRPRLAISISAATAISSHSGHHHSRRLSFPHTTPTPHLRLIATRCSPPPPTAANHSVPPESDLAPIPLSRRTFTAIDMASLWVGLVVGVPSYYLAGSLVGLGMSWWQGVATVFVANSILLIPLILTAVPGTRHGIPFPVLARSAFGPRGAHVPALLRALVGCGWYGIESWIGGQAVFLLLPHNLKSNPAALTPIPYLGTTPLEFACFLLFWVAQLAVVMRGMDGIKDLEKYSAPILIVLTAALLGWAYVRASAVAGAGGLHRMMSHTPSLTPSQFWPVFFPAINANISFWATVALNIPDFTRYAKTQKDQILGQAWLPIFMGAFTFVGLAVTSATEPIFGYVISDPIQLLGKIGGLSTTLVAIFGISLATITTNIAANVVAPANALVNVSPGFFTFRKGALVTALLGIAFQPWQLLGSSESFVYTWLLGYSAIMGPIAGIVLADYYIVKGMDLDVEVLYSMDRGGPYYYQGGYNVAAMVALVLGALPIVPGFLDKAGVLSISGNQLFGHLYNNAWFVSFFVSGVAYWLLSTLNFEGEEGGDLKSRQW